MDSYLVFTRDKEMIIKYKKRIKYTFSKWVHVNSNKSNKCPNYDLRTPRCVGTTKEVLNYNNAEMRYYKINFKHLRNVLFNNLTSTTKVSDLV